VSSGELVTDVKQWKCGNDIPLLLCGILGSGMLFTFWRFIMQDKCSNCGGSWIKWEVETWTVDVTDFDRSDKVPLPDVHRRRCGRCRSVQVRTSQSSPWEWEKIYSPPETRKKCRCCDGLFEEEKPVVTAYKDRGGGFFSSGWINVQHRRCNKCKLVDKREQIRPDGPWTDWTLHQSPPHVMKMFEAMREQFHDNREKYRVKSFEILCAQMRRKCFTGDVND